MEDKRKYHIIIGSKAYFDANLPAFNEGDAVDDFLQLVKLSDAARQNYSDYFFGDAPNRRSLGFDLLERESNLIFFDELDKCPEYFYSAFYTLFDNTLFKDATYDADVSGAVIVLTSNFHTEDEMKSNLVCRFFIVLIS